MDLVPREPIRTSCTAILLFHLPDAYRFGLKLDELQAADGIWRVFAKAETIPTASIC
jgi:hypothetical protein